MAPEIVLERLTRISFGRWVWMAKPLVSDELWKAVALLLLFEKPKPKGGRPRLPDRAALTGTLFVLRTGTPW